MKIHTDLVENKRFKYEIASSLLKHSQEYWALAILRYFFPQKYSTMSTGESPDLQDCKSSVGIEVTAAVQQNDMKATNAFSKLYQVSDERKMEKYKRVIEACGYSFEPVPDGKSAISTTGTLHKEKICFQKAIRKKKEKLSAYKVNFNVLGLAVLLPEIPTSEAEASFVDWIREAFQGGKDSFDFLYVISHRFCIYYDIRADCSSKKRISNEENKLLRTIARMTAEGELSLESQEWK